MRLLALLVVMMLGLGAQAVSAAQASGNDVPMYRGDPARTGVMPGPGPDPANGIAERWRFEIEGGGISFPAVVDATVYVSGPDGLYALDAASGAQRWQFATGSTNNSFPVVVDGTVYVGSGDGLYAVDAATGGERWRFATESGIQLSPEVSPAVVDGVVYVVDTVFIGERLAGNLYAVDAASGEERWRSKFEIGGISSLAVVDSVVYLSGSDGLYAFDAASGRERWRFAIEFGSLSWLAVTDGVVYVGSFDFNHRNGLYAGSLYAVGARQLVIEAGGQAVVREDAVLRGAPASTGVERATLEQGTAVEVTDEAVTTAGEAWWPVRVPATDQAGWVRAEELEPTANTPRGTPPPES